jgi:hypothetical protein
MKHFLSVRRYSKNPCRKAIYKSEKVLYNKICDMQREEETPFGVT